MRTAWGRLSKHERSDRKRFRKYVTIRSLSAKAICGAVARCGAKLRERENGSTSVETAGHLSVRALSYQPLAVAEIVRVPSATIPRTCTVSSDQVMPCAEVSPVNASMSSPSTISLSPPGCGGNDSASSSAR